jgi:hypothetical protein
MSLDTPIDETDIPGSPGSKIYWFEEFEERADTARQYLDALSRIPEPHRQYICPVIVPETLPRRIRTHGAFYGHDWRALWSEEGSVALTNVSAVFLEQLAQSNSLNRLVGIPRQKAIGGIRQLTLIHEVGHSIGHSVSMVPTGATALDFPGIHYPRNQGAVEELATECYARWVLRRTNLVWQAETRTAFHNAHAGIGLREGETAIADADVDARYEAICRATLERSRAMQMPGVLPPGRH